MKVRIGQPFQSHWPVMICSGAIREICRAARSAYPREACGMLGGLGSHITQFIPIRNSAGDTVSFRWEPADFFAAVRQLDRLNLEWLGVVHSHPFTPPVPSSTDVRHWHYHDLSYWIVSLQQKEQPVLCLYRLVGDKFVEEEYPVT